MKTTLTILVCLISICFARPGVGPGEQEWGYVTVRPEAHMFWWLYFTTANVANYTDRPLLIWLQGGPGASSTGYGNFAELGPLDLDLNPRNFTWVKDANVLFIDNPVGSGFSYVDSSSALTTTNIQIAFDLVELMRGFYTALPEFETVPLYILCESYGGKMAIEFALQLDAAVKAGTITSNLKGTGLGDGWLSPVEIVLNWAPYLWNVGGVDMDGFRAIDASAQQTKAYFDAGQYSLATDQWGTTEQVIWVYAENIDFYNILTEIPSFGKTTKDRIIAKPQARDDDAKLEEIMNGIVTDTLGVTHVWGSQSNDVFSALYEDFMKPATDIVELVLNNTNVKVFVYNGQLDLIVCTPGVVQWVDQLKWPDVATYKAAPRDALSYNGINEGYKKEAGNFGMYWVNRAGHMVPADNPKAMDAILRILTNDYSGIP